MNKEQNIIWFKKFIELVDKMLGKDKVDAICKKAVEEKQDPLETIKTLSKALNYDQNGELTATLMIHMTHNIGEDEVLQMVMAGDGMTVTPIQELVDKAKAGTHVYYTCMDMRPGLGVAMSEIEHSMFPPASPINDLFEYYKLALPPKEGGIPMTVFGVPAEYKSRVDEVLASNGLKVKGEDQTLAMFGPEGVIECKVVGKGIYPLENVSSHMVYKSNLAASTEDRERSRAEAEFRKQEYQKAHPENDLNKPFEDVKSTE